MLRWVAGGLGFTGAAGAAAGIAEVLFWLFGGVFLLVLVVAWLGGGPRPRDVG